MVGNSELKLPSAICRGSPWSRILTAQSIVTGFLPCVGHYFRGFGFRGERPMAPAFRAIPHPATHFPVSPEWGIWPTPPDPPAPNTRMTAEWPPVFLRLHAALCTTTGDTTSTSGPLLRSRRARALPFKFGNTRRKTSHMPRSQPVCPGPLCYGCQKAGGCRQGCSPVAQAISRAARAHLATEPLGLGPWACDLPTPEGDSCLCLSLAQGSGCRPARGSALNPRALPPQWTTCAALGDLNHSAWTKALLIWPCKVFPVWTWSRFRVCSRVLILNSSQVKD